jgi:hypothetical protein
MPFNTPAKNTMLDALDESLTQITHIGAATSATDPGTGTNFAGTEATGGSPAYARQAVTWGGAAGEQKTNSNAFLIDVPAGTYAFFPMFNAITGNTSNYKGYIPFGGAAAIKGVGSIDTTLTNDQILSPGHGLADGDRVVLYNVFGGTLATGLTEGTLYYVVSSTTNTFKVSLTAGGAAVDITALGNGAVYFQKTVPETFNAQGQISVAVGALVLDLTAL